MCGRYALGIRASFVRYQLQQQGMRVDDAPEDDVARETYNFPPGSFGLVYRADIPDSGLRDESDAPPASQPDDQKAPNDEPTTEQSQHDSNDHSTKAFNYHLKAMKWGLIPFWTKRSPDYSSMLRTINCRDDSLYEARGMWNTMKQRKRCIVVAQGFYEWLKKGPKEKVPHFVKRKDGQLMLFAGLWDCVRYEDSDEKLYSYTVITTSVNKQLAFLHDRMPVILDPGSDQLAAWLDPRKNKWTAELQRILKPYEGELECYPVSKDVGKVGNNSPEFIVPVDSKENKKNIANFFDNAKKQSPKKAGIKGTDGDEGDAGKNDDRITKDHDSTENHAPVPVPPKSEGGTKRKLELEDEGRDGTSPSAKALKLEQSSPAKSKFMRLDDNNASPTKSVTATPKKTRSATSNQGNTMTKKSPVKSAASGSQRITSFFGKTDPG